MAQPRITALSLARLTLSLLLITSSSSQHHDEHRFQVLDVSASLQQARQVFSPILAQTSASLQELQHLNSSSYSADSLSLTLHPRSALPFDRHSNNYTHLTLSRLARDDARVRWIHSHHPHWRSRHSHARSRHSRAPWADKAVRQPEQFESPLISGIELGSGEYFARIGVGRPVKEFYMVIDSGSDVSWLQCQPCYDCYPQADPIFAASASSTYKSLTCKTEQCESLDISACSRMGNCIYQVSYGDGSYTVGNFATETISFGVSGSVPNVAIGCGHDNEGLFSGAAGLIGLGGGNLSLPSQMRATSFSYCLVNRDSSSSSTLDFNTARPADSVLATLLRNPLLKTFRYVDLTGISVGGRALPIPSSLFAIGSNGKGGVIVDSGTSVTRLQTEVYSIVRDAFKSMTQNLPPAGRLSLFDTCYNLAGMTRVKVPTVSFQFSGGKTLSLPPNNYLIPVDNEGKFCFAFAATSGPPSIMGNVQQQGTRVSFDLVNNYIGFSPNKC
ncbi:protein ASPARTIC PROTEASE IN GUARD CELL 1 [Sesamum angolense]|uniref:Protein ASPARTIC PROTEASE IN GUARD CELL 1 n=1 Tax=Sesamum angolense TaxID=2727404 RepID=A0AAE1WLW1_9LAMI|nr:protein ASPARTIC PROTEASE IN GUARD CELL 1 [Sesamum angolense]